jgi:hypothetical protein
MPYDGAGDVGLHHRLIAKPHDHDLFVLAEPVSQPARSVRNTQILLTARIPGHHQTAAVGVQFSLIAPA